MSTPRPKVDDKKPPSRHARADAKLDARDNVMAARKQAANKRK